MATLPDVEGYTRFWHQMADYLYRQLSLAEQAVHIQLFRLSWGRGEPTCRIGLPKLCERTGIRSQQTVHTAVKSLIGKGLVRKVNITLGKGKEQGSTYEIVPPPVQGQTLSPANSGGHPKHRSLPKSGSNKEEYKEQVNKEGAAREDVKNCTDCHGALWRPKGGVIGNPVERCPHSQLREGK